MTTSDAVSFDDQFVELFDARFRRLHRFLARLSGDSELASDLAQDALVRLYRRGSLPDAPDAWLVSVALNLFRNVMSTRTRRRRLMTIARGARAHSDPSPSPAGQVEADEVRHRVRSALDQLPERERQLLLLLVEGYPYRDIAAALGVREASVGTLLARAKRRFLDVYGEETDAP